MKQASLKEYKIWENQLSKPVTNTVLQMQWFKLKIMLWCMVKRQQTTLLKVVKMCIRVHKMGLYSRKQLKKHRLQEMLLEALVSHCIVDFRVIQGHPKAILNSSNINNKSKIKILTNMLINKTIEI